MAKNTTTSLLWEGVPEPDDEAWWIESIAERHRERFPPEPNPWRPGFERRSHRDITQVMPKLAKLQTRYYDTDDKVEIEKLGRHAMLLLIPLLAIGQNRLCQYTGKPCNRIKDSWKDDRVNCQLRNARHVLVWQILMQHAVKEGRSPTGEFSWPIISIRERKRSEIWENSRGGFAKQRRERKQTIIGMAVLQTYKANRHKPGNTIDAAIQEIVDLGSVDGEKTGKIDNATTLYKEYRKMAFQRGYADDRAFWAHYFQEDGPADQLWLRDFPPVPER